MIRQWRSPVRGHRSVSRGGGHAGIRQGPEASQQGRLAQPGHGGAVLHGLPHSQGQPPGREGDGLQEAHAEPAAGAAGAGHQRRRGGGNGLRDDPRLLPAADRLRAPSSRFQHVQFELVEMATEIKLGTDLHRQARLSIICRAAIS